MPERTHSQRVQLETLGRLINPQAFRARDTGRGKTSTTDHQVAAATAKAEAIMAAAALRAQLEGQPVTMPAFGPEAAKALRQLADDLAASRPQPGERDEWLAINGSAILEVLFYAKHAITAVGASNPGREQARLDAIEEVFGRYRRLVLNGGVRPVPDRAKRQAIAAEWAEAAFGADHASSPAQRAVRFLEESVETFQAATAGRMDADLARGMAHRLVDFIMDRPPGEVRQELGGAGLTLILLAQALGADADSCEATELARVLSKPLAHFRARNEDKNAAGFDVTGQAYPTTGDAA